MNTPAPRAENLTLAELCTHIRTLYRANKSSVSGELFALLAQRLIAAEVTPGGPYKDQAGDITADVNQRVGELFHAMGTPLPNVDAFLFTSSTKQTSAVKKPRTAANGKAYENIRASFAHKNEPLRTQAHRFLSRVAHADSTGEIAHIAAFAAAGLGSNMSQSTLIALGEANIYGWIAYMIYDHIIDGDSDATLLPLANIAMRRSVSGYQKVAKGNTVAQGSITTLFDELDEANAWELENCRFTVKNDLLHMRALPRYGRYAMLARRSGIHILGPLIAACTSPIGESAHKMELLTKGLRHYLIARQLSDDIHDWKEDFSAGHITPVVAELLKQAQPTMQLPMQTTLIALQQNFMNHTMEEVCRVITRHTTLARRNLKKAGCADGALLALVTRLEHMAADSLAERARFIAFRDAYKN